MTAPAYIFGSYRALLLPDGSITYYREILTPDGRELIGLEYPSQVYCWFSLKPADNIASRLAEMEPTA
jgi:hypothetical protein